MKIVIGIHGKAGAGKSTLASILKYLITFIKEIDEIIMLPFAKPLKDFAFKLGWNGKKDSKGRKLLQLLGTEVARKCIDEDIWIKHWMKDYEKIIDNNKIIIIICDDMRFTNEFNLLQQIQGITIKIHGRMYDNIDTSHESEYPLPNEQFQYIIDNSGTLSELEVQAQKLLDIRGKQLW